MPKAVHFVFVTGINQRVFSNVKLSGSWDAGGSLSANWSTVAMNEITGADGCPAFEATVNLNAAQPGQQFQWGVVLDAPEGPNIWGIMTEVPDPNSSDRYRVFNLDAGPGTQEVEYDFTSGRRLGARKVYPAAGAAPQIVFSVWAPDAQAVSVVFGLAGNGYIDNGGGGIDPAQPVIPLAKTIVAPAAWDGTWDSDPALYKFSDFVGKPYMFRVTNEQGVVLYRTDIYSRRPLLSKINAKAQRKHGLERVFDGNLQVLKVGLSYSSSEMLSKINAEKPLNQSQFEDVPGRLLWISELFWTGMRAARSEKGATTRTALRTRERRPTWMAQYRVPLSSIRISSRCRPARQSLRRISGRTNSRPPSRSRPVSRMWSSMSCTSARSASGAPRPGT
jgi:1,4-alpha-glucan branching enzyme